MQKDLRIFGRNELHIQFVCLPEESGIKKYRGELEEVYFYSYFLVYTVEVSLSSESVEGSSLSLERVDHIERGDRLSARMLRVGHSVADHVLEEDLENASSLFVDESTNTLDSASSRETTNRGLGDSLDVITKNLSVALGPAFA